MSMWSEILLAVAAPPLLLLGWLIVQEAWRKMFLPDDNRVDVLAARGGCGNCGCTGACERDNIERLNRRSDQ